MEASKGSVVIQLPGGGTVGIEPLSSRCMGCSAEVSIAGRMYQVGLEFERADPCKKWRLVRDNISPAGFSNRPDLPRNAEGFVDPEALLEALRAARPDEKLVKATRRVIKKAVLEWAAAHPGEVREMLRRVMLEETTILVDNINTVKEGFLDDTTPIITLLTDRWLWAKFHGRRLNGGDAERWRRALRAAERAVAELEQMAKWVGRGQRKPVAAAA